jgi:hypothetical protein
MACDIYSFGERRVADRWVCVRASTTAPCNDFGLHNSDPLPVGPEPFDRISYPEFAFLADVRNDWGVPPISEPRGLPKDASAYVLYEYQDPCRRDQPRGGSHSASWLTIQELIDFNYEKTFEDRAPSYELNGQWYYEYKMIEAADGGRTKTYREFLGPYFLNLLHTLKLEGVERLIFWFD